MKLKKKGFCRKKLSIVHFLKESIILKPKYFNLLKDTLNVDYHKPQLTFISWVDNINNSLKNLKPCKADENRLTFYNCKHQETRLHTKFILTIILTPLNSWIMAFSWKILWPLPAMSKALFYHKMVVTTSHY